jgi:hypothetical protein
MKIVVTVTGKKGRFKTYLIEVIEGERIIQSETAEGAVQRDEIVWKMAELYNILDIETREELKFTTIPSIPVLEEMEADEFFEDNREFVYDRILQAVSEGLTFNRTSIRLFELNGTGVYITSNRGDWKGGLQDALDYYVSIEDYDKCTYTKELIEAL